MAQRQRVSSEQIIVTYKSTGSVWKTGKTLGICGQSVWERLSSLGYRPYGSRWTPEEEAELANIARQCTISEAASRLGRSYAAVACKLSELGIGVRHGNLLRTPKLRGSGLNKESMTEYVRSLSNWAGSLKQFCIQRGFDLELFVQAWQKYFPQEWLDYAAKRSDLEMRSCPVCSRSFIPMTKKQKTCTRRCGSLARNDLKYFGGKRSSTIGLAEGVCQICGRSKASLSSHHIFGKENDPENDYLIAVCSGCHKLVGMLASRSDINNAELFENLIGLALARKYGHRKPVGFHICVDIDELTEGDTAEA